MSLKRFWKSNDIASLESILRRVFIYFWSTSTNSKNKNKNTLLTPLIIIEIAAV